MIVYVGDGCYAEFKYGEVELTTRNGERVTNSIVLDYGMIEKLWRLVLEREENVK